ncbi:MAG: hypothetical protein Fur0023_08110 [Bacteroidia bacterium]
MKTIPKFLALIVWGSGVVALHAQDVIFTNSGKVYEGKVVEVTDNYIKYRKKENPDGPVYSLEKSMVTKIKYENNKEEIVNQVSLSENSDNIRDRQKQIFDSIVQRKKNIVGYDVAQFFYVSVGMAYERFFGKQNIFSIRIPFSIGFNYVGNNQTNLQVTDNGSSEQNPQPNYYIYQNGKIAGASIEFNYYPFGIKKFVYFVGPYFEYGVFAYRLSKRELVYNYNNYYNPYPYYDYVTESNLRYNGQHIAGGISNGFLLHLNKVLTLTGTFGLGLKKDETVISGERIITQAKFNFIFGLKF